MEATDSNPVRSHSFDLVILDPYCFIYFVPTEPFLEAPQVARQHHLEGCRSVIGTAIDVEPMKHLL